MSAPPGTRTPNPRIKSGHVALIRLVSPRVVSAGQQRVAGPSGAVQCRPGPRPPSTDGAPRPAVGAPSTDQVGERRNCRSSGLRVRGFRGHGDLERGSGAVGSVGAGRGRVAQQVGWCNPPVASRRPMRSSREATCGPCRPPWLIRCLGCVASASVSSRGAAGECPAVSAKL